MANTDREAARRAVSSWAVGAETMGPNRDGPAVEMHTEGTNRSQGVDLQCQTCGTTSRATPLRGS